MARPHTAIDRRALITGRLPRVDRVVAPQEGEIASILVQARPERLAEVEAAIVALPVRRDFTSVPVSAMPASKTCPIS